MSNIVHVRPRLWLRYYVTLWISFCVKALGKPQTLSNSPLIFSTQSLNKGWATQYPPAQENTQPSVVSSSIFFSEKGRNQTLAISTPPSLFSFAVFTATPAVPPS